MTGEMYQIDPVTAVEPDGTEWPYHAAIAKAVSGVVKPFDQYQGPYVAIGPDPKAGRPPYDVCLPNLGAVRLWLVEDDGLARVYREDTDTFSSPFEYPEEAGEAALEVMRHKQTKI